MNEFDLIKKYVKEVNDPSVVLGAGDDCCILDHSETHYRVVTSDALIEHKHFRLQDLSFKELGYKSLAVNLSDISAMGGVAKWCQLTLALPKSVDEKDVEQFFSGFYELAETENISLVGGDLSSSDKDIFINVTLSGLVEKQRVKKRSDFYLGEIVCVTGALGDSATGLRCLLENKNEAALIKKHIRPKVYHKEGQWLSHREGVYGMMDLSDGLMSDLKRLNCGVEIELTKLPLSSRMKQSCEEYGWDAEELSVFGGEDYVLIFSCDENIFERLKVEYEKEFDSEIRAIGVVSQGSKDKLFKRDQEVVELGYKEFSHY